MIYGRFVTDKGIRRRMVEYLTRQGIDYELGRGTFKAELPDDGLMAAELDEILRSTVAATPSRIRTIVEEVSGELARQEPKMEGPRVKDRRNGSLEERDAYWAEQRERRRAGEVSGGSPFARKKLRDHQERLEREMGRSIPPPSVKKMGPRFPRAVEKERRLKILCRRLGVEGWIDLPPMLRRPDGCLVVEKYQFKAPTETLRISLLSAAGQVQHSWKLDGKSRWHIAMVIDVRRDLIMLA